MLSIIDRIKCRKTLKVEKLVSLPIRLSKLPRLKTNKGTSCLKLQYLKMFLAQFDVWNLHKLDYCN